MLDNIELKKIKLSSVTSTNDYAKALPEETLPASVSALKQTGGRGRLGRSFWSPSGKGVYLSYVFEPGFASELYPKVTAAAACCVCRVLEDFSGERLGIKWVNDIYRKGLKICGILTELVSGEAPAESGAGGLSCDRLVNGLRRDRLVIGVGVNVLPTAVPEELEGIAGSLLDAEPGRKDKGSIGAEADGLVPLLADKLAEELHCTFGADPKRTAALIGGAETLDYYRSRSLLVGREVKVWPVAPAGADCFSATVISVDENFGLVVESRDGRQRTLTACEVTLHGE